MEWFFIATVIVLIILRLVIADPKCGENGKDINYLWSENIT